MHFELLVEEPSAEKVLENLLPRIITGEHSYRIITFQGKMDMLKHLPSRLKGYKRWINSETKIIVLIDRDRDDCYQLKKKLEQIAMKAELITKSSAERGHPFDVLNRIAIEELEAWFFGDPNAVHSAYPKVSSKFSQKAAYRNPDNISGGTWETLERILKSAGYFKTGIKKIEAAHEISRFMNPLVNRSKSFQVFWEGITSCINLSPLKKDKKL